MKNLGFDAENAPLCFFKPSQLACIKNQLYIMQHKAESMCPMCKPACHSSVFSFEISKSKIFTKRRTINNNKRHNFNSSHRKLSDVDEILPTDAVVKIVYLPNVNEYIVEQPAFELIDFFLYTANVFNLFLGMSFVSFCEFFMQIILTIHRHFV